MKTVLFRGPTLTQSGYGCHARQVARWLLTKKDINLKFVTTPWGDTPWIIDKAAHGGLIGEIMTRSSPPAACDVSIQLQLPNEWDRSGLKNVGITAAVETDKCNPSWIAACNSMDIVIVPSQHAKASLTNTGTISSKLLVVPESFNDACSLPVESLPALPKFPASFNFLVFGQLTGNNPNNDRKNTFYTIKWLCEAFKDNSDVGIVIKTNSGRNSLIDRKNTKNIFEALLREVRKGPYPKVTLFHGDMSDHEVAALYRHPQIKALVTLTRGEGFGLPILEAAASGLPIVATDWSGHLDFLKKGKFVSVYYQLGAIHPSRVDDKIFMKGARWANPSEEDFKKRITKFHQSPSTPREWATDLQKIINEQYSFAAICRAYDEAFKDII